MKVQQLKIVIFICLSSFSSAEILNVPSENYPTIQTGIDSAGFGDTVLVAENTYYENINFKGKAIAVASQFILDNDTSHISRTIIDGSQSSNPDSGSVVYFISGEDTNSVLTGFTITGGSGTENDILGGFSRDGGGILILNAGAKISNNIIIHNWISTGSNLRSAAGIAVFSNVDDYVIINGNEICENMLNERHVWGAGVFLWTKGTIDFNNNIVKGNIAMSSGSYTSRGGGIVVDGAFNYSGQIFIRNNKFIDNQCAHTTDNSKGGGMFIHNAKLQICRNVFSGNICYGGGGAIFARHDPYTSGITDAKIINNTICRNEAPYGAGIEVSGAQAVVEVLNSIIWNNYGNEIDEWAGGQIFIYYSDIEGGVLGKGNINDDPMFVDSLYHLHENSPCRDAGHPGTEYLDMDGSTNDMGAYGGPDLCVSTRDILANDITVPRNFIMTQNYPNPFNPTTTIEFSLPKRMHATIKIFDILGEEIITLVSEKLPAGTHQRTWNASDYASGVYIYTLTIDQEPVATRKLVLLK